MNNLQRVGLIILLLIMASFAVEFLNYADWLTFGVGILLVIACIGILSTLIHSIIKPKIKSK